MKPCCLSLVTFPEVLIITVFHITPIRLAYGFKSVIDCRYKANGKETRKPRSINQLPKGGNHVRRNFQL